LRSRVWSRRERRSPFWAEWQACATREIAQARNVAPPSRHLRIYRSSCTSFDRTSRNSHHLGSSGYHSRRGGLGYPGEPGCHRFTLFRAAPRESKTARATTQRCDGPFVGPRVCTRLGCRFAHRYRPNSCARTAPPRQGHFPNTIGPNPIGQSSDNPQAAAAPARARRQGPGVDTTVGNLTDKAASKEFRELIRQSACKAFTTVLGARLG
jgi:hypothetical protein